MHGLTISWFRLVRGALLGRAGRNGKPSRRCGSRLAVEQFENRLTPSTLASELTAAADDASELVAPVRVSRVEPAILASSADTLTSPLAPPPDPTAGPPPLPPEPPTPPNPPGPNTIPPVGTVLPIEIKVPEPPPLDP
jgi:hypothetical protein